MPEASQLSTLFGSSHREQVKVGWARRGSFGFIAGEREAEGEPQPLHLAFFVTITPDGDERSTWAFWGSLEAAESLCNLRADERARDRSRLQVRSLACSSSCQKTQKDKEETGCGAAAWSIFKETSCRTGSARVASEGAGSAKGSSSSSVRS